MDAERPMVLDTEGSGSFDDTMGQSWGELTRGGEGDTVGSGHGAEVSTLSVRSTGVRV